MIRCVVASLVLALGACTSAPTQPAGPIDATGDATVVVDAHVHPALRIVAGPGADLATGGTGGQFDAPRARTGRLRIAFASALVGNWEQGDPESSALRQITAVDAQVHASPDVLATAGTPSSALARANAGKLVLVHALENGRDLGERLDELPRYRESGVRMMSLVHSATTNVGDAAGSESRWDGLSPLGMEVVARANALGLWLDVSHASEATVLDAAGATRAPLIASHTAVAALVPDNPANLSDASIRAIAGTDGLVCTFFGSEALLPGYLERAKRVKGEVVAELKAKGIDLASAEAETFAEAAFRERLPRATVADVADHVDHVVRLVGARHACIGSDFDGIGPTVAQGLDDASRYPALLEELRRRGYSGADLAAIAGGNLMRVWEQVEALRERR